MKIEVEKCDEVNIINEWISATFCSKIGNVDIFKWFVEIGVFVNAKYKYGKTNSSWMWSKFGLCRYL